MQGLYPTKWNAAMGEMADANGVLSVQARLWKRGLSAVTTNQIMKAVDYLTDNHQPFIPDLGEFKALCVHRKDCPTVEQIISILANSAPTQGTIAKRYKHPLALAVVKANGFDAWVFKTASLKQCMDMVKPIYTALVQVGWDDFLPEHYEEQKAIAQARRTNPALVKECLVEIKKSVRCIDSTCTVIESKPILADEEYFTKFYEKRQVNHEHSEAQAVHPIHEFNTMESEAGATDICG